MRSENDKPLLSRPTARIEEVSPSKGRELSTIPAAQYVRMSDEAQQYSIENPVLGG